MHERNGLVEAFYKQKATIQEQATRIEVLEAVLYEAEAALKPYTGQDIRPGKAYTLSRAAVQGMRAALRGPGAGAGEV